MHWTLILGEFGEHRDYAIFQQRTSSGRQWASCEVLTAIIGQRASILQWLDAPIENAKFVKIHTCQMSNADDVRAIAYLLPADSSVAAGSTNTSHDGHQLHVACSATIYLINLTDCMEASNWTTKVWLLAAWRQIWSH